MSLCALIYSKITKITSVDDMTQIMIVSNCGIQLYSSLSLLARKSMLMLPELPGMVTVFEQFFQLNTVTVILVTSITTVYATGICHSQVTAFETLLALNYNSFIFTVAIIGVGIYSTEAGYIMSLILMLEICIITVIVKGHVYCWNTIHA